MVNNQSFLFDKSAEHIFGDASALLQTQIIFKKKGEFLLHKLNVLAINYFEIGLFVCLFLSFTIADILVEALTKVLFSI